MTDLAAPLPTDVDGKELTSRGAATRDAPARGGRDGLRRARLSRRLDRQDHRGRRRRAGHVLPLLRRQAGDLRGARARPEPARPARDGARRRGAAARASRRSCSASRALLRVRGAERRALPDHPAGGVRLARRRCTSTTTRSRPGTSPRSRPRWTAARSRRMDPQVLAWALMGMGELLGMRWIVWEDAREVPPELLDGDAGADRRG